MCVSAYLSVYMCVLYKAKFWGMGAMALTWRSEDNFGDFLSFHYGFHEQT